MKISVHLLRSPWVNVQSWDVSARLKTISSQFFGLVYFCHKFSKKFQISKLIREKTGGLNRSQKKWSWRFNVFNSQVQPFKTSSPGQFQSVTNPKRFYKERTQKNSAKYHDKDCMHHRTPISFLRGKVNYWLIST